MIFCTSAYINYHIVVRCVALCCVALRWPSLVFRASVWDAWQLGIHEFTSHGAVLLTGSVLLWVWERRPSNEQKQSHLKHRFNFGYKSAGEKWMELPCRCVRRDVYIFITTLYFSFSELLLVLFTNTSRYVIRKRIQTPKWQIQKYTVTLKITLILNGTVCVWCKISSGRKWVKYINVLTAGYGRLPCAPISQQSFKKNSKLNLQNKTHWLD